MMYTVGALWGQVVSRWWSKGSRRWLVGVLADVRLPSEEAVVKQDQRMAFSPDIVVELGSVYPNPAFVLDHDIPPTSRLRAPRHRQGSLRVPQPPFSTG